MDDFKSTINLIRRWNGQSIQTYNKSERSGSQSGDLETKERTVTCFPRRIKKERKDVEGYGF